MLKNMLTHVFYNFKISLPPGKRNKNSFQFQETLLFCSLHKPHNIIYFITLTLKSCHLAPMASRASKYIQEILILLSQDKSAVDRLKKNIFAHYISKRYNKSYPGTGRPFTCAALLAVDEQIVFCQQYYCAEAGVICHLLCSYS